MEGKEEKVAKAYSNNCGLAEAVVVDLCDGGGGVGGEAALVDWVVVEGICAIVPHYPRYYGGDEEAGGEEPLRYCWIETAEHIYMVDEERAVAVVVEQRLRDA